MRRNLLVIKLIAAVPLFAGSPAVGYQEPIGYERVVDLTFPVSGDVHYTDDYHHDREGGLRKHQATDIFAAKLAHIHAAVGGTICFITGIDEPPPSYGYLITICGDDSLQYTYIHINNDNPGTDDGQGGRGFAYAPGIDEGMRVERGQWIGHVGDSGNAEYTSPHLHFEIFDPYLVDPRLAVEPYEQGRINPFNSLEAARARGDVK